VRKGGGHRPLTKGIGAGARVEARSSGQFTPETLREAQ